MSNLYADDDIADLFARANPAPNAPAPPDAESESDLELDLGERVFTPVADEPRERWWLVIAVAAAVALVVSLAVTTTESVRGPAPADEPSTVPASLPPADDATPTSGVDTVEQLIAAFNDHDPESIALLATDDLSFDGSELDQLDDHLAWYEAFGWRWEDASCLDRTDDRSVACDLYERNRLTDLTGVERPARLSVVLNDGAVESVRIYANLYAYSSEAFEPFHDWVTANHPDDPSRMWVESGPVLTAESAALFDARLTEYVGLNSADPSVRVAHEFVAAVNRSDAAKVHELIAPGAAIAVAPITPGEALDSGTALEGQLAWREAWNWRWEHPECHVDEDPDRVVDMETHVRCVLISRNRLDDVTGRTKSEALDLRLVDGAITLADGEPLLLPIQLFGLFRDWAQAERATLWAEAWDDSGPLLTLESTEVERRLLDEYLALQGVTTTTDVP